MKGEGFWTIIGGCGTVLFMIGACAADSDSLAIPVVMILAGLALCYASAQKLEKNK
ncbi:MAG: hypothetical protein J6U66_13165 [Lachnospiraceae bacterium]|nr:hypothetical protein [Lachnospiraceae bacterium]